VGRLLIGPDVRHFNPRIEVAGAIFGEARIQTAFLAALIDMIRAAFYCASAA
jgi:hypothetical protein